MEQAIYWQQYRQSRHRLEQIHARLTGLILIKEQCATEEERRELVELRKRAAERAQATSRAEARIRELVDAAPPLSPQQRIELARIFAPGNADEAQRIEDLRNGKARVKDFGR